MDKIQADINEADKRSSACPVSEWSNMLSET